MLTKASFLAAITRPTWYHDPIFDRASRQVLSYLNVDLSGLANLTSLAAVRSIVSLPAYKLLNFFTLYTKLILLQDAAHPLRAASSPLKR